MKNKKEFIDDGRTIANMNVEGMPWYNPSKGESVVDNTLPKENAEPVDMKTTMAMMGGVLKAALLIAGIFVIIFLAFILFCVFVWFK